MSFQPNTSLSLNLPTNDLSLDLLLDLSSSSSSSSSLPLGRAKPRVYSCNYCRRKFYSSQALGGHQNAHKLERTLAKKSRVELSLTHRSPGSTSSSSSHVGRVQPPGQARSGRREINYASIDGDVQEEFSQLDLSLRL